MPFLSGQVTQAEETLLVINPESLANPHNSKFSALASA